MPNGTKEKRFHVPLIIESALLDWLHESSKMRVLITGTTGWLGGELAKTLSESQQQYEVYGLSRRPTNIDGVTSIQADITNKQDMEELSRRIEPPFDVVVHLAGAAGWCSLEQGIDINVGGTRNLVEACQKAGTTKFVIASSVAVTGSCTPNYPPRQLPITHEHGFIGSKWAYALSKHMVEDVTKFISTSNPDSDIFTHPNWWCRDRSNSWKSSQTS